MVCYYNNKNYYYCCCYNTTTITMVEMLNVLVKISAWNYLQSLKHCDEIT
jgi:hypothetical protein